MAASMQITGLSLLDKELAAFEKRATRLAVLRRAVIKAADPMLQAARSAAPDGKTLRASIQISARAAGGDAAKAAYSMVMHESGDRAAAQAALLATRRLMQSKGVVTPPVVLFLGPSTDAPHAGLVEFGTGPRVQKTTGRSTGQARAQPYMRPAWDRHKSTVIENLASQLRIQIDKTAATIAKRAAKAAAAKG